MQRFVPSLKMLALAGNVLLVLWMLYNAIDEGFRAAPPELASYVVLTVLLVLNSVLLFYK